MRDTGLLTLSPTPRATSQKVDITRRTLEGALLLRC